MQVMGDGRGFVFFVLFKEFMNVIKNLGLIVLIC